MKRLGIRATFIEVSTADDIDAVLMSRQSVLMNYNGLLEMPLHRGRPKRRNGSMR